MGPATGKFTLNLIEIPRRPGEQFHEGELAKPEPVADLSDAKRKPGNERTEQGRADADNFLGRLDRLLLGRPRPGKLGFEAHPV